MGRNSRLLLGKDGRGRVLLHSVQFGIDQTDHSWCGQNSPGPMPLTAEGADLLE